MREICASFSPAFAADTKPSEASTMAARISFADLSDATGIPADLLAKEATSMQREPPAAPSPPAEPSCPTRPSTPLSSPSDERAAA